LSANFNYQGGGLSGVSYGRRVVGEIVWLAATEISGVAALQGRKIKLRFTPTAINVDVFLTVLLGISASEVAFKVQENIKRTVESMTAYKVGTVNVNILGIVFKELQSSIQG